MTAAPSEEFTQHGTRSTTSLDPENWPEFREQAHRMLDDMLDYTAGIKQQPVWQVIPEDVRAQFRQALPAQPTSLEQVHQEFMTSILPYTARNGHPGARAVVLRSKRDRIAIGAWMTALEARAPRNVLIVATANKLARIAWAVLSTGQDYRAVQDPVPA